MSEHDADIIQAQDAPLSHLAQASSRKSWSEYLDWRNGAVAALVIAAIVTAVFWRPEIQPAAKPNGAPTAAPDTQAVNPAPASEQLAPFAQTQRARARELAQDALAKFVERQILLEDTMQVQSWGAEELAAAMALAQTGDAQFLAERFEASLAAYEQAVESLAAVVERGNELFEEHVADAERLIAQLEPAGAENALQQALVIKPDDAAALALLDRARRLPEIIGLLRTAKNHELGGRYTEALELYARVHALDPQTTGLAALRSAAAQAQAGDDLTGYISRGFAALDAGRFEDARSAFNAALKIDANNDIAKGGLQQVAKENDLAIIRDHKKRGDQALADERWQVAIDAYQAVLALDGNIQFALNGLRVGQAHQRIERLLQRISKEPQKLSSEKLYLDAVAIVADARQLSHAGPQVRSLTAEVDRLLQVYRDPVDVVLVSDNATNVIVSNVGPLGFFERKTLTLRPGQYTIRGSQDGCRDIFLSIEVLPGIAPLDLSCAEPIKP